MIAAEAAEKSLETVDGFIAGLLFCTRPFLIPSREEKEAIYIFYDVQGLRATAKDGGIVCKYSPSPGLFFLLFVDDLRLFTSSPSFPCWTENMLVWPQKKY